MSNIDTLEVGGTNYGITDKELTILINKFKNSEAPAASHNSIYIKEDITDYYKNGELWDRIAGTNGFKEFEGIYPGMYFDTGVTVKAPESDQAGSSKILVLGCDMHRNNYNAMRYNHLTCCPATHFGSGKMNDKNVTTGGYVGSKMYNTIIGPVATSGKSDGTINEQLYNIFGSHLKTTKEILSKSVNTTGYNRFGTNGGCANSWDWYDIQSILMSEVEAFGSIIWSSSGYDTGNAKKQFPAFRENINDLIPDGIYWWLKDVGTAADFARVHLNGFATCTNASLVFYVRPRFIIA